MAIVNIDRHGVVTINSNITVLNFTVLNATVLPGSVYSNIKDLNLTSFEITSFGDTELIIQLKFEIPLLISYNIDSDILLIELNSTYLSNSILSTNLTNLTMAIPRQHSDSALTVDAGLTVTSLKNAVLITALL